MLKSHTLSGPLFYILVGFAFIILPACNNEAHYSPKPKAYPKVEFPKREFQAFTETECPFTFSYPTYSEISFESREAAGKPAGACWFDVSYTPFNARLHCTYSDIQSPADFEKYLNDAFVIANRINERSNFMEELLVSNSKGVGGLVMEFKGPAASPMQFFLTDSTSHFMKAALYFNAKAVPDSLAPIAEFIKEDIAEMINTFEWK